MTSSACTFSWDKVLCAICRQLFDHFVVAEGSKKNRDMNAAQYSWHDIPSLEISARLPCGLCALVLTSFETPTYKPWLELLKTWNFRLRAKLLSRSHPAGEIDIYICFPGEDPGPLKAEIWDEAHIVGPIHFRLMEDNVRAVTDSKSLKSIGQDIRDPDFPLGGGATSHSGFGKIQAWIKQCEVHHNCSPLGRVGGPSYAVPTRLLELARGYQHPQVKLVSGRDLPAQETKYASLSHCWGRKQLPRLLHGNVQAWRSNIPWQELSKTFQEAIKVTEVLGFSHLWIDALCIIQDSEEDWSREAALMTDVYSNSSLNIAADASVDGEGGLFRDRHAAITQYFMVPLKEEKIRYILYINGWPNHVEEAPMRGRAWVVQERFLAPRTVHFSQDQLHWECQKLTSSEGLPDHFDLGRAHQFTLQKSALQLPELAGAAKPQHDTRSKELLYRLWYQLVETYSSAALTYPSDKPIAIAGLAGAFQRYLRLDPSDYVCGLWRPDLISGLLWCCAGGKRTYDDRIPTWSWLSLDPGTVCWYLVDQLEWHETAQILDVNVTPVRNPFGHVSFGSVRIRGPLCQATLSKNAEPFDVGYPKEEHGHLWGYYTTVRDHSLLEEEGFLTKLDEDSENRLQAVLDQPIYLLLVRIAYQSAPQASKETRANHSLHHDSTFECLIIMPTEAKGHFRRIGYLKYEGVSQYASLWREGVPSGQTVEQAKRSCEILEVALRSQISSPALLEEPDYYDRILHTITLL